MQTQPSPTRTPRQPQRVGIAVRTNLRASLAWDDLDDQAASLWNSLTSTVSNAVDTVKASVTPTES